MKITEHVSDRSEIEGVDTNVDIEVDSIGGSSSKALEVAERLETAVKEEIKRISEDQDDGNL